eukprot:46645_1
MYFAFLCFLYCTFKSTRCMDGFYDKDMASKEQSDPMYKIITEEFVEKPWVEYRDNIEKEKTKNPENWKQHYSHNLIEIPVVIHVIYEPEELIIGSEQIQSAFRELNDAFFDINYYNKEEIEEFAIYRGNFSMQFKLSTVKYIDGTGEDSGADDGWEEEQAVNLSPADDQNHYLHFYIVPYIFRNSTKPGLVAGRSSFPYSSVTISECLQLFGFPNGLPNDNECLNNSPFTQMFQLIGHMGDIGNNVTKCMKIMSLDTFSVPGEYTQDNCMDEFNSMMQQFTELGFTLEGAFDGNECVQFHKLFCDNLSQQYEDKTQIIIFNAKYFGTNEDNKRKTFSDAQWYEDYFGAGNTVPHEVGHWVGLNHIFSISDPADCEKGDEVSDTFPQLYAWSTLYYDTDCPSKEEAISCGTADMYNNYMDYSECDDLKYIFTQGQVERGRFFFEDEKQFRHSFMDYRNDIVTKFINSIYFINETDSVTVNKNPCHSGDVWIKQNINIGNEDSKIYMCATYTMNPYVDIITELKFTNKPFSLDSLNCGGSEWKRSDVNLNYGNSGEPIFLCYKKHKYDPYDTIKPITNINILVTNMEYSHNKLKSSQNWDVINQNVNENPGSDEYVYLIYNKKPRPTTDIFAAGVKPIRFDNIEEFENNIGNYSFSYDTLVYLLGLSSGLNVCVLSGVVLVVIYWLRDKCCQSGIAFYDEVKQNEVDEQV